MARRRGAWIDIPGTPARYVYTCVEREGVAILCVRLAGSADNSPDGVGRVKDGLDELAASLDRDLDVSILDVNAFSNAADDACQILTGALTGLPCCWITRAWDQQEDGRRWDLPASEQMAPDSATAIDRVVGWRRAGGLTLVSGRGRTTRTWRWTGRGLVIRDDRDGALEYEDVWHRNRLVERTLPRDPPARVLWPFPDRTGAAHEGLRRRARVLVAGDRVVEVDFSPWQTRRPLADDWVESLADLTSLATLGLRGADARAADIVRAVRAHPGLRTIAIGREELGPEVRSQLERERPGLALR